MTRRRPNDRKSAKAEGVPIDRWGVQWADGGHGPHREISCRACGQAGAAELVGHFVWPFEEPHLTELLRCSACGSVNVRDESAPDYGAGGAGALSVRFYVEQGAGIDFLAEQAEIVSHQAITSYCEIGCGFGFSLDYARQARGWQVRGVDPSASARTGANWLSLPIESRYSTPQAPPTGGPFDVVAAYEVIEHVEDVPGFLASALAALKPGGTLLLTTPNGAAIRPECSAGMLFAILSPGYHLTHFTAEGLERALRKAGLHYVEVRQDEMTLRAAASHVPLNVDWARKLPRESYTRFLDQRIAGLDTSSPLFFGLSGRAIREASHSGVWANMAAPLEAYRKALRQHYGLDLTDLKQVEKALEAWQAKTHFKRETTTERWGRQISRTVKLDPFERLAAFAPFNLGSVLYFQAMQEKLHYGNAEAAAAGFRLADMVFTMLRAGLRWLGSEDGEAEQLQGEARIFWLRDKVARDGLIGLAIDKASDGLDPLRSARLKLTLVRTAVEHHSAQVASDGTLLRILGINIGTVALADWQNDANIWLALARAAASPEREDFLRRACATATGAEAQSDQLIAGCLAVSALAQTSPAEAMEGLDALTARYLDYIQQGIKLPGEFPDLLWRTEADALKAAERLQAHGLLAARARFWRAKGPPSGEIAWVLAMYSLNVGLDYPLAAQLFAKAALLSDDEPTRVRAKVHEALALASAGDTEAGRQMIGSNALIQSAFQALGLNDAFRLLAGRLGVPNALEAVLSFPKAEKA